jgi:hypothetical protein
MKTLIQVMLLVTLSACATAYERDMASTPHCFHEKRVVYEKCMELNRDGKKINAVRVDEMMRQGQL